MEMENAAAAADLITQAVYTAACVGAFAGFVVGVIVMYLATANARLRSRPNRRIRL